MSRGWTKTFVQSMVWYVMNRLKEAGKPYEDCYIGIENNKLDLQLWLYYIHKTYPDIALVRFDQGPTIMSNYEAAVDAGEITKHDQQLFKIRNQTQNTISTRRSKHVLKQTSNSNEPQEPQPHEIVSTESTPTIYNNIKPNFFIQAIRALTTVFFKVKNSALNHRI